MRRPTSRRRRRTLLMVPFAGLAGVLVMTSAAWACGIFNGTITLTGNYDNTPRSVSGDGSNANHIWAATGPTAAARSCFAMTAPIGPCAVTKGPNSWVDVFTGANGTAKLPDSTTGRFTEGPNSQTGCQAGDQTVPPDLGTNPLPQPQCAVGDKTGPLGLDSPAVAITAPIGDYFVNLELYQWIDGPAGLNDDNYNTQAPSPSPDDPVAAASSGRVAYYTGCGGFNPDATWRVLHLGLATINTSGEISNAFRPTARVDRDFVDWSPGDGAGELVTPQPSKQGTTNTWRFPFPATLPTGVTNSPNVANVTNGVMASAVCVMDRYGLNAVQAPLELMVL